MSRLDLCRPVPTQSAEMQPPSQTVPTYLIAVAVGAHIVGTHPGTAEAVAGVLVFLVVGMSTAYTPVLLAQFLPDRPGRPAQRLRDWLERYWYAVAAVLLLVVGGILLAKGRVALG